MVTDVSEILTFCGWKGPACRKYFHQSLFMLEYTLKKHHCFEDIVRSMKPDLNLMGNSSSWLSTQALWARTGVWISAPLKLGSIICCFWQKLLLFLISPDVPTAPDHQYSSKNGLECHWSFKGSFFFWGPNGLFLGLKNGSKTVLGFTYVVEQLSFLIFFSILIFDFFYLFWGHFWFLGPHFGQFLGLG